MIQTSNGRDHLDIHAVDLKNRKVNDLRSDAETQGNLLKLVSILICDVPEAEVYVRSKACGAERARLPFE